MDDFLGMIKIFAGSFAPKGWVFCQGQILQIQQYQAMYAILGPVYGGDGKTTFGIPDLRGRIPVGMGLGNGFTTAIGYGEKIGAQTMTLGLANIPAHTHAVTGSVQLPVNNTLATLESPAEAWLAQSPSEAYAPSAGSDMAGSLNVDLSLASAGGSTPFNLMPPYVGANYIICMSGLFPSRD